MAALFSCSPGEKAFEHERLKHGVFYYYVIQGLKNEADLDKDGTVSVEELALFAKRRVPDFVKEEYGFDVRQMPVLRGEVGGLLGVGGDLRRPQMPAIPPVITNSIGMKLVLIPAGEFLMGSPKTWTRTPMTMRSPSTGCGSRGRSTWE